MIFSHYNTGARASRKKICKGSEHFLDKFTKHTNNHNLFFKFEPRHQIVSESKLISTKEFKNIIKKALLLLKKKAPDYYGLFCLYNIKICATDIPGVFANFSKHSIEICSSLKNDTDATIAASLIHETIHFWQQESGQSYFGTAKNRWRDSDNQACELEAIKHEINVLRLVGGTEQEIKFQEKQRGTHAGFMRYQP